MFGYLAVPLLFGTIVMPIISGTLLRFVVKTYTDLAPWSDLASAVLWFILLIYYDISQKFVGGPFRLCFDAFVVAVVIYQTYRAIRKKVRRTAFSVFLIGIVVCFLLDWFSSLPVPLAGVVAWTIFVVACVWKYGLGMLTKEFLRKIGWT